MTCISSLCASRNSRSRFFRRMLKTSPTGSGLLPTLSSAPSKTSNTVKQRLTGALDDRADPVPNAITTLAAAGAQASVPTAITHTTHTTEGRMSEEWKEHAYQAARIILRNRRTWTGCAETLLALVIERAGEPKDRRSFGGVIQRLQADGYIRRVGVGRAKTSHRSLKTTWARAA